MKDLSKHLQSLLSVPSYVGSWPATPIDCVAVRLTYSFGRRHFAGQEISVQYIVFMIRHRDYTTGMTWAEAIRTQFHQYSDLYIKHMFSPAGPRYLRYRAQRTHEFEIRFKIFLKE